MQIGIIGLGRMGGNMARRLMRSGHDLVLFNRTAEKMKSFVDKGATGTSDLRELVSKLEKPRVVWIMLPAGEITENTMMEIAENLSEGDIIIDGGNSNFKDDIRRANLLKEKGIRFLDTGTSGGIWGAERGYCLMVGGAQSAFKQAEPIFKSLAPGSGDIEESKGRESFDSTASGRLSLLRQSGRRAFRQNGSKRHRIRNDAGDCRRLRYFQKREQRYFARRAALGFKFAGHRRIVAARIGCLVVAARFDRTRTSRKSGFE